MADDKTDKASQDETAKADAVPEAESSTAEPTSSEAESTAEESTAEEPAAKKSTAEESTAKKPAAEKPAVKAEPTPAETEPAAVEPTEAETPAAETVAPEAAEAAAVDAEPAQEPKDAAPAVAKEWPPRPAQEPTDAPAAGGRNLPLLPIAAAASAVLLIAALVGGIFYYMKYHDLKETTDAKEEARGQVCEFAKTLVTYDYNNLDPFFKNVLDGATGEFKSLFEGQSKALKQSLVEGQVKSSPGKIECGVKSGSQDEVQVVLSIGQLGSSIATKGQPQQADMSMVATAKHVDGKWLVSNVSSPLQMLP
ncbi:MAG: hypothetical protein HOQ24_18165 [Mycobacteriaceae bacterium]|nr:hypothetical protein [Mycobacteriaceae bacterium]